MTVRPGDTLEPGTHLLVDEGPIEIVVLHMEDPRHFKAYGYNGPSLPGGHVYTYPITGDDAEHGYKFEVVSSKPAAGLPIAMR